MISRVSAELMQYVNRMGPQEWVLVLGAAIVVGAFCLRGFGSRSNY
jgi:hypothetical protein